MVQGVNYAAMNGPGNRVFYIPASPDNTREHARWICGEVFGGEYEHAELPTDIKTALDIGSHCGPFATWASRRWPSLERIDCYEPNVQAIQFAEYNAKCLNGTRPACSHLHIALHVGAVTSHEAPRYALPWDWGSAKTHGIGPHEGIPVRAIHPSTLPAADLLKCDAEGVEAEVLSHYPSLAALKALIYEWHSPELKAECSHIVETRTTFRCIFEQQDRDYGVSIWLP